MAAMRHEPEYEAVTPSSTLRKSLHVTLNLPQARWYGKKKHWSQRFNWIWTPWQRLQLAVLSTLLTEVALSALFKFPGKTL